MVSRLIERYSNGPTRHSNITKVSAFSLLLQTSHSIVQVIISLRLRHRRILLINNRRIFTMELNVRNFRVQPCMPDFNWRLVRLKANLTLTPKCDSLLRRKYRYLSILGRRRKAFTVNHCHSLLDEYLLDQHIFILFQ